MTGAPDAGAPEKRRGRGRTPQEITAAFFSQVAARTRSPSRNHLEVNVIDAAPIVREALDAHPDVRAELLTKHGQTGALVAMLAAFAEALTVPVKWRGGLNDFNGENREWRGNSWAQLVAAVEALDDVPSQRTARRRWQAIEEAGDGVRVEQNDREPVSAKARRDRKRIINRKWKAPERKRKDGTPLPTSELEYNARRICSIGYLSAKALRRWCRAPLLAPVLRTLNSLISRKAKHLRAGARRVRGGGSYQRAIKYSRAEIGNFQARRKRLQAGVISLLPPEGETTTKGPPQSGGLPSGGSRCSQVPHTGPSPVIRPGPAEPPRSPEGWARRGASATASETSTAGARTGRQRIAGWVPPWEVEAR